VDEDLLGAVIVDYKTTEINRQKDADRRVAESLQLKMYALAWQEMTGTLPQRVELRFVDSSIVGRHTPTAHDLDKAIDAVKAAAVGYSRAALRRDAVVGRLSPLRLQPDLPVHGDAGLAVNRHAGPPRGPTAPSVPEPSYAERARTLAYLVRSGSARHALAQAPGTSVRVGDAVRARRARPAARARQLDGDAHAESPGRPPREPARHPAGRERARSRKPGDPLAAARLTLLGEAQQLAAPDAAKAREAYLARHPRAAYWVDFDDFSFWRLDVRDVYFVGGFAAMDWVTADDYRAARPDPLADAGPGIIGHMNKDHADALIAYARHFAARGGRRGDDDRVDRLGFRLRLRSGDRLHAVRIAFPARDPIGGREPHGPDRDADAGPLRKLAPGRVFSPLTAGRPAEYGVRRRRSNRRIGRTTSGLTTSS
jgi:hypothetical protein